MAGTSFPSSAIIGVTTERALARLSSGTGSVEEVTLQQLIDAVLASVPTEEPVEAGVSWLDGTTLKRSAGIAPTITTQPQSQSIEDGESVNFTIAADNAESYQWRRDGVDVEGETATTLTIAEVTTNDSGAEFDCVVTGPGGSTTSDTATLTVTAVSYVLISDTFSGTDGDSAISRTPDTTNEPGNTWAGMKFLSSSGTPAHDIQGNQLRAKPDATSLVIDAEDSDVVIEVDWLPSTDGRAYIPFRSTITETLQNWEIRIRVPDDDVRLFLNGSSVKEVSHTFTSGETYAIKVIAVGQNIRVFVDGLLVLQHESTTYQENTIHGIGRLTATDAMRLDNFVLSSALASLTSFDKFVIDGTLTDCDAMAVYDISGSGKTDIVTSQASGASKALYWFEQTNPVSWTRHTIDDADGGLTSGELESVGVLELESKLLVLGVDQDNGNINIYTPTTPGTPAGSWTKADLLDGRPWLMTCWTHDIDGDGEDEIIFAYEGTSSANGGIGWLDFTGTDPMDPADWTEHTIIQHPGAFWVARELLDIAGNGRGDMVFCARNEPGRNPDHVHGVYWLEAPADITQLWTLNTIDNRDADWHKVEVGNFSGDVGGRDVIAGDADGGLSLASYSFADSYARTDITQGAAGGVWNLRKVPTANGVSTNGRDAFIAPYINSFIYLHQWDGSAWTATALDYPTQGHPLDNIIEWVDLDGDGKFEAMISDSSDTDSKLAWIRVE